MTIIIIDDDPQARTLTVRTLARAGYSVQSGSSAHAAIDMARNVKDIALIILDIHMPGASGYDALQILKSDKRLSDIPVLMLSATADVDAERDKALNLGAVNLLSYPLADDVLLEWVKKAFGRRRSATDLPTD